MRFNKFLGVLLSTLLTLTVARSHFDISPTIFNARSLSLNRRAGSGTCRSLCSPKSCCKLQQTANTRRTIDAPSNLKHRALFPYTAATVDASIVQRFTNNQVNLIFYTGVTASSSAWRPITATTPAFDVGLSALCGCTTVIIASANGVYGAHFFEDQAWGQGDAAFTQYVVNFLQQGNGLFPGIAGDVAAALAANNEPVAAYILTPQRELPDDDPNAPGFVDGQALYGQSGDDQSSDQVNKLADLLRGIMPQLQGHVEIELYQALEGGVDNQGNDINPTEAALLDNTSRGRVLFQYDPQNNGVRSQRLFFETNEVFTRNLGPSPPLPGAN